jgi:hypothetical protein
MDLGEARMKHDERRIRIFGGPCPPYIWNIFKIKEITSRGTACCAPDRRASGRLI